MESEFNPKDILLIFGENIRKSREKSGYRISELSESIGYDRGCLTLLECGVQNIKYLTALKLARKLNASFPALFSRNYLNDQDYEHNEGSNKFIEDDYLLVFIENFQKEMKRKMINQVEVYAATDVQTAVVSRIINRKMNNPTLSTLYALAYTVEVEMHVLFTRNTIRR